VTFKFLIDECLWPGLVQMAREAGHWESTCVRDRGWSGSKDHQLIQHAVQEDYTLVTHNAVDFRGPPGGPVGGWLDGFREDARRFRHLMLLAEPHADGWRIELPGDMPFERAIDTDMQTRAVIAGLQRSARGDSTPNDENTLYGAGAGRVRVSRSEVGPGYTSSPAAMGSRGGGGVARVSRGTPSHPAKTAARRGMTAHPANARHKAWPGRETRL
jgi:hypothetical protein